MLEYGYLHGKNEQKTQKQFDNETAVITSHSLAPVPFVIFDPQNSGEYDLVSPDDAGLSHIAATTLNLLGYQAPHDYNPSLIRFN